MLMYLTIRELKTLEDVNKVNRLLVNGWILLEICKLSSGNPLFILGREFQDFDEEKIREDGMK